MTAARHLSRTPRARTALLASAALGLLAGVLAPVPHAGAATAPVVERVHDAQR